MAAHGFRGDAAADRLSMLFQPIDHGRSGIVAMAYAKEGVELRDPTKREWYITKGDADQDRPN